MPEYLAPGVYVEETSFRSKSIEGVSTTTTGFVGPTRFGPINLEPDVITSLGEFERVYGDRQQLEYLDGKLHNYMWHAARGFFEEGGKRLYVMRAFTSDAGDGKARSVLPKQPVQIVFAAQFIDQAIGNAMLALDAANAANDNVKKEAATKALKAATDAKAANQSIHATQANTHVAQVAIADAKAALLAASADAKHVALTLVLATSELARLQAEGGAAPDDVMQARIAQAISAKAAAQKAKDVAVEHQSLARTVLNDSAKIAINVANQAKTQADAAAAIATSALTGSPEATAATGEKTHAAAAVAAIPVMADADADSDAITKTETTLKQMNAAASAASAATQYATSAATKVVAALAGAGGGAAPASTDVNLQIAVSARFPGQVGNRFLVRFKLSVGKNALAIKDSKNALNGITHNDAVLVKKGAAPGEVQIAVRILDAANQPAWELQGATGTTPLAALNATTDEVLPLRLLMGVTSSDGTEQSWDGLALDPKHPDAVTTRFIEKPASLAQARTLPVVISAGSQLVRGWDVYKALFGKADLFFGDTDVANGLEQTLTLTGGNDGALPAPDAYEGVADPATTIKTGLKAFEDIEDISIVAAPGCTAQYSTNSARANTIINLLISHAERMRYMIAVLDSGEAQSIAEVRTLKARLDSKYAALYYPWVKVLDPVTREEIALPPSGFVSGIYARNDINRAVWKAPANEVVNSALSFELLLNKSQQDVLNPEGINCFRYFEGRGLRLWGARTTSSDPEWKYVNLRRYFAYLERSIDRGTQWAVFEPNGEALWANVRRTIEDFLFTEWNMGALLGEKPERAYFVKCDRTTMTQNDLDNGRLVCLIGVAPVRPAEFVIFRIGQWTGDRKV